jgi:hypothetical protein
LANRCLLSYLLPKHPCDPIVSDWLYSRDCTPGAVATRLRPKDSCPGRVGGQGGVGWHQASLAALGAPSAWASATARKSGVGLSLACQPSMPQAVDTESRYCNSGLRCRNHMVAERSGAYVWSNSAINLAVTTIILGWPIAHRDHVAYLRMMIQVFRMSMLQSGLLLITGWYNQVKTPIKRNIVLNISNAFGNPTFTSQDTTRSRRTELSSYTHFSIRGLLTLCKRRQLAHNTTKPRTLSLTMRREMNLQQGQCQISVYPRLELDLNLEVQVQPQLHRIATTTRLLWLLHLLILLLHLLALLALLSLLPLKLPLLLLLLSDQLLVLRGLPVVFPPGRVLLLLLCVLSLFGLRTRLDWLRLFHYRFVVLLCLRPTSSLLLVVMGLSSICSVVVVLGWLLVGAPIGSRILLLLGGLLVGRFRII